MSAPTFRDGPSCFQVLVDGQVAGRADYELSGDTITFTHTEVDPQYEGQGVGSQLAKHALDQARQRGLKVLPACGFIAATVKRHPEYAELVPQESRGRFGL